MSTAPLVQARVDVTVRLRARKADKTLHEDAAAEIERLRALYNELVFAAGKKYQKETRHETALRYIKTAEGCEAVNLRKAKKAINGAPR